MKITAIISEYNPFHNGHLYHLEQAKKETDGDFYITVMSGNFVQRGQTALFDKYERAKIAITAGFDAVIELPTIFAVNNAERFAYGAIRLLKNIPELTLSFGSEAGSTDKLKYIADFTESEEYADVLKSELSSGISYPVACNNALKKLLKSDILDGSNNILAVEYIKSINKMNANIALHTVKRVNNYNSDAVCNNFLSATAIRNLFTEDTAQVKAYMPDYSYDCLKNYVDNTERLQDFMLYKVFDTDKNALAEIFDVTEGLENRIKASIQNAKTYEEFIGSLSTKRYSASRINRIMLNILLNIKKTDMLMASQSEYMNILAVKKGKTELLGYLNKYAKVITKYADSAKLNDSEKYLYDLDRKSEKLYALIKGQEANYNTVIVE